MGKDVNVSSEGVVARRGKQLWGIYESMPGVLDARELRQSKLRVQGDEMGRLNKITENKNEH